MTLDVWKQWIDKAGGAEQITSWQSDAFAQIQYLYSGVRDTAQSELDALINWANYQRTLGNEVTRHTLYQTERYQGLVAQLEAQISGFRDAAASATVDQATATIESFDAVLRDQYGLIPDEMKAQLGTSFGQINPQGALANYAEWLNYRAEGPMQYFESWGYDTLVGLQKTTANAVLLGWSAKHAAKELDKTLGVGYMRAQTIARTEVMRVQRRATQIALWGNRDIYWGWRWSSSRDHGTCAVCWAMEGTFYEYNKETGFEDQPPTTVLSPQQVDAQYGIEVMRSHPNCRCVMVPVVRDLDAIALREDGQKPIIPTGSEQFRTLPDDWKLRILGKQRLDLYNYLRDMTGEWPNLSMFVQQAAGPFGTSPRLIALRGLRAYQDMLAALGKMSAQRAITEATAITLSEVEKAREGRDFFQTIGHNPEQAKERVMDHMTRHVLNDDALLERYANMTNYGDLLSLRPAAYADVAPFDWVNATVAQRMAWLKSAAGKQALDDMHRMLIHQWAMTSGDSHPMSIALQMAAKDELGLDFASLSHFADAKTYPFGPYTEGMSMTNAMYSALEAAQNVYSMEGDMLRAFIRAQYEVTQSQLEAAGITHVRLVRGVGSLPTGPAYPVLQEGYYGSTFNTAAFRSRATGLESGQTITGKVTLQPMSSFSHDISTAEGFGDVLVTIDVPADWIMATPKGGFGCLDEAEWVVIPKGEVKATITSQTTHLEFPGKQAETWSSLWSWAPNPYYVGDTLPEGWGDVTAKVVLG